MVLTRTIAAEYQLADRVDWDDDHTLGVCLRNGQLTRRADDPAECGASLAVGSTGYERAELNGSGRRAVQVPGGQSPRFSSRVLWRWHGPHRDSMLMGTVGPPSVKRTR